MQVCALRRAALVLALAAAGGSALAQPTAATATAAGASTTPGWPSQAVKIIVGFPGGSSPDLAARTLAEPLAQALGQPVIVENRVGAGGNIGASAVARATDNHTIGLMINGNLTIAKLINPKAIYDPLQDLVPVSLVGTAPLALAAPANAPGASAQEFFTAARQAGDHWSYGTPGVGTVAHIGMELLKAKAGIDPVPPAGKVVGDPEKNAMIDAALDAWLTTNNISFEELSIVYMEHQNWLRKGTAFLKRKFFPKKDA